MLKHTLKRIDRCLAQSEIHRKRFIRLGMPEERVVVTGNLKFDLEGDVQADPRDLNRIFGQMREGQQDLFLLAASTHLGEEAMLLTVFQKLKCRFPRLKLLIAPRHVERSTSIEQLIHRQNLASVRLSGLWHRSDVPLSDILIIDEWGILNECYAASDIVFVGGSLVPHGGHNLAEAAMAEKPIVYGPYMQNFRDMEAEFAAGGAAIRVKDSADLERVLWKLIQEPEERKRLGQTARAVVVRNQGATNRVIEEILLAMKKEVRTKC